MCHLTKNGQFVSDLEIRFYICEAYYMENLRFMVQTYLCSLFSSYPSSKPVVDMVIYVLR